MNKPTGLVAYFLLSWNFAACSLAAEARWEPLFNGKNFDGWYTYIDGFGRDHDPDKLIQVDNGMIHAYKDAKPGSEQPHGYLSTNREYSHYRLRLQYKWGEKRFAPRDQALRDAGVMYHVVGKDAHAWGVWPMSLECQIQEGDTGDLITVDTRCTSWISQGPREDEYPTFREPDDGGVPFKNTVLVHASEKLDRLDGWNDVEIEVRGSQQAVHIVNGKVNLRLADIERPSGNGFIPLGKGRIVLQIEGAEVLYRNVEIQPLEPLESEVDPENSSEGEAGIDAAAAPAGLAAIKVPDGLEVVMAAASPLVKHPMMACLDDRGRLFISESDGVNRESVEDILATRPHSILMLEDTDGDGEFDKRTVFAEGLVQPNGAEWYDGALYVCSAPYVWRFRDLDGDGKADEQVRIAGKFGFDGMSSAFHGPVLGPDGRLYWSGGQHGWKLDQALNEPWSSAPAGAGGPDAKLDIAWTHRAPGAFSSWPDGSDPVDIGHGGLANPVETAFTEEGEVFGTIAVFDYIDNQRRDAVVHWTDGSIYNLKHHLHPGMLRTGADLTPTSLRGHAAPAGITRYRSDALGSDYRDRLFLAEFNTRKIYTLELIPRGATFTSKSQVFLESSDADAHFTDVIEDADGSLLVINTGGWFLYGCPSSQIAKPDILGAIYRIRRKDHLQNPDPRGVTIDLKQATPNELVTLLEDSRFVVRDRAVHELSLRGEAALKALDAALDNDSPDLRRQVVWTLNRIRTNRARNLVRRALGDDSPTVRMAAIRSATLHRDQAAEPQLAERLKSDSPAEIRAAATALGRIGAVESAPQIVELLGSPTDRALDHALIVALVRLRAEGPLAAGLASTSPAVRRGCLVGLNLLDSSQLTHDAVAAAMDSGAPEVFQAVLDLLTAHPEFTDLVTSQVAAWIATGKLNESQAAAIRGAADALATNPQIQQAIGQSLSSSETPATTRILLLDAIAQMNQVELSADWLEALQQCLRSDNTEIVAHAIDIIGQRNLADFDQQLLAISLSEDEPLAQRLASAAQLVRRSPAIPPSLFDVLLLGCRQDNPPADRMAAAHTISAAPLTDDQLLRLTAVVSRASPVELATLARAFERCSSPEIGEALVAALASSSAAESLSVAVLDSTLASFSNDVRSSAQRLREKLQSRADSQAERLIELVKKLPGGDPTAGRAVFFGQKAACSSCHRIGDEGELVGPNLSGIGEIRARRDLIEAVAFPSSSFAREFEPYTVLTADGKAYTGIIARQSAQAIHVIGPDRVESRVPREEIEDLQRSDVSIMPQGLDGTLSPREFADLISFLQAQK